MKFRLKNTKFVFIDAEFTGEHQFTTLVSIALVGEDGEYIHLTFNQYDPEQVTDWLRDNVIRNIEASKSVSYQEGFKSIKKWLENYRENKNISLISVGKTLDIILLFQLWHLDHKARRYFHNLHCLPEFLNHSAHFDLPTIFWMSGIDPEIDRNTLLSHSLPGKRHDALYDARVVRECFYAVMETAPKPVEEV